jgi:hypothetical protein
MFCLDVVQIFGLQPQVDGRLLPLLSQSFCNILELLIRQIRPWGAGFIVSGWKKTTTIHTQAGQVPPIIDDVQVNQNVDITSLEMGVRG